VKKFVFLVNRAMPAVTEISETGAVAKGVSSCQHVG